jgi:CRP/FNR family cyclic AMP-dependent transcriptional regulator
MPQSCFFCKARKPRWFCSLSPQSLTDLNAMSTHTVLPMGNTVFREGQASRSVSVVLHRPDQAHQVLKKWPDVTGKNSRSRRCAGVERGTFKGAYEVTTLAIEHTQSATFEQQHFLDFIRHHAEGSLHAAESLSKYFHNGTGACDAGHIQTSVIALCLWRLGQTARGHKQVFGT